MTPATLRNALIGLTIGALITAVVIGRDARRGHGTHWHVLSEGGGAMTAVALQYAPAGRRDTAPAYRAFLTAIGRRVEVTAVCPDSAMAAMFLRDTAAWKVPNPSRLHTVVVGKTITTWCKDRFLVTSPESNQRVSLLLPKVEPSGIPGRDADAYVGGAISRADPTRYTAINTDLAFDAGDFLSTGDTMIVSDSLWNKNARDPHFLDRLKSRFGGRIVWLHGAPDHHVGMFVAILDKTALVGDTRLAQPLWDAQTEHRMGRADFSPEIAVSLAAVQNQLRKAGYHVLALPTIYFGPKTFLSYTNGVFETRGGKQIVYMPWYDEPPLDNAARATYESLGCEVHPIPVKTLYRYHGTIGCLINVLRRTSVLPS